MEGNRRLGWIAIGIGVLALLVALSGRMGEPRFGGFGLHGYADTGYGRSWEGPRGGFSPDGPQVAPNAPRGEFGPRGHGYAPRPSRGPFFFLPFFFLGGLLKLLGFAALAFLVFKLLRRNRDGGPRGPQGPQGPGSENRPPRPGPEGYTGETTNL